MSIAACTCEFKIATQPQFSTDYQAGDPSGLIAIIPANSDEEIVLDPAGKQLHSNAIPHFNVCSKDMSAGNICYKMPFLVAVAALLLFMSERRQPVTH